MSELALESRKPGKPGRKPRFDRTRTVQAIADLFWAKGYDGVALSDIMSATGLSKSSLYNSFGDKDDLFRIALASYHTDVVQAGAEWLASDDGSDPWDRLDALLSGPAQDRFGEKPDTRGCFLCNTASDGHSGAPDIDALVGEGFAALTEGLTALLRRAAPNTDPDKLRDAARLTLTTYVGMRVQSRHAQNRDALDSTRGMLLDLLRAHLAPPA